jgi:GGDEF domain-containing protein
MYKVQISVNKGRLNISWRDRKSYFESVSPIEFRNNGSKDSLTGAPTAALFLEFLEREIALRERLKEPLTVVMISIPRMRDGYQIFLLNQSIRLVLRKEDFYCRASEDGFWIAMRTDADGAKRAGARFATSIEATFRLDKDSYRFETHLSKILPEFKIECVSYRPGMKCGDWIKEIDRKYFSS